MYILFVIVGIISIFVCVKNLVQAEWRELISNALMLLVSISLCLFTWPATAEQEVEMMEKLPPAAMDVYRVNGITRNEYRESKRFFKE